VSSDAALTLFTANGPVIFTPYTLMVFVDETGGESLTDDRFPVFGLGGCAVLAADYHYLIDGPWRRLKKDFGKGADEPIHASETQLSGQGAQAFGRYFANCPFFRFASLATRNFANEAGAGLLELICGSLVTQVAALGNRTRVIPDVVAYVIEHSQLAERINTQLSVAFGSGETSKIEPVRFFTRKQACVSGVEVADFPMHTAGCQERNRMSLVETWKATGMEMKGVDRLYRKDFVAAFMPVDHRLADHRLMLSATEQLSN
jgi:hypothetical protein